MSDAATRAVAIDDTLAEAAAHASLNWLRPRFCRLELERGGARVPSSHRARLVYLQACTWFAFQGLAPLGRFEEATGQIVCAPGEPLSSTLNIHAAMVALQQHRTDDVIEYAGTALELDPSFLFAHVWLGMAFEHQRRGPTQRSRNSRKPCRRSERRRLAGKDCWPTRWHGRTGASKLR